MKHRFQWWYRAVMVGWLALLAGSLWVSAQTATNSTATNTAPRLRAGDRLAETLEQLQRDHLTFGLDRVDFLRANAFLGQPLWKYLASLIYIALAFYFSKLLDFLTNVWLKRWAARTQTPLNALLLDVLHGPVKVIAFVVFLEIGLDVFDWGTAAQSYLNKGFILVVALSLTYVAVKVVDLLVGVWRQRAAAGADKVFDEQLFPLISKSLKIFTVIVAVLVTAANLHIDITGALASLSVGALAVGLAAQDTLANLFAAVAVYMDKPFRIGDRVRLDIADGIVETIGLRSTRIRSLEGHLITIPNKTVGNATIINVSKRPNIKTEMNFGLTYDTPAGQIKRAVQILEDIYRTHPKTSDLVIGFNKFGDSALNIQVTHSWDGTDHRAYLADLQGVLLQVKERFDAEGIAFAFPSQTVYLRQDSEWKVSEVIRN